MHLPTSRSSSQSLCSNLEADIGVTPRNPRINCTIAQIGPHKRRHNSGGKNEIGGIANNGARRLRSFIEASFPQDWRTWSFSPYFWERRLFFTTPKPPSMG